VPRRRRDALSAQEARWLAVEAQGLARERPRRVGRANVVQTAVALGAVQLDAINVVERTQFQVLFSRLGPYAKQALLDAGEPGGRLWEYWGHAASLQAIEDEPLFRWRYERGGTYNPGAVVQARIDAWRAATAEYAKAILEEVGERGPLTAGQLSDPRRRQGDWWDRQSLGKRVLDGLFSQGIVSAWRLASFERVYDLADRVVPAAVRAMPTPTPEASHRELLMRAARAYGVATVADLAGYFMLQFTPAKARVAELVASGELVAVDVEGWTDPAYCLPDARPRRPSRSGGTLVSPFDSLVWDRKRTLRVFGFDYRIEVYVPAPKRVHGYYVLPLLLGDQLVARFDLKADRKASALRVVSSHLEPGVDRAEVIAAARDELALMQQWLGLDGVDYPTK
jgi:uncharacterized protein YcaQ